ncbi:MAG: hypothetical protein VB089_12495, partial [Anaerolineaceae bacterium]|nr:hypothetical protein [Anaerolineaceae bacterium]
MTLPLDDLLATKLEMPQLAPRVVRRSRLTEALCAALQVKVSLVTAPAGYGKTTLLGEWIINGLPPGWQVAWLSLDGYDNEITRFWSYVVGALHKSCPGLNGRRLHLAQPDPEGGDFTFLDPLINQLAACPQHTCLVLDDYHLVTAAQVHHSLAYFVDHQPRNFHLVIASRVTPPVPLARLRARGQLAEVSAADLSFTPPEVDVFFSKVMGVDFGREQVEALASATEGWIAALKLAALSAHGRRDLPGLYGDANGLHRQVFDFLLEEVLAQQDAQIREFLLKTSVLNEFSAPLCDAILERSDSQQLLEQILRQNLFVVSLDSRQNWFRYHQLFSETLYTLLQRSYPGSAGPLRQKACRWMQDNDYPDKAVSYALDAGDLECAARIIDACALEAVTHFNITRLIQWINRLSPDLLDERPQLGIYAALACLLLGRAGEVQPHLEQVERSLRRKPAGEPWEREARLIHWQMAAIRAVMNCLSGDAQAGMAQIIRLRQDSPAEDNYFAGNITHILAESYAVIGQPEHALEEYARGMDFARRHGLCYEYAYSLTGHAHALKMQGRLSRAAEDYRRMLDYTRQCELSQVFHVYALTGRIEIAVERHDLADSHAGVAEVERRLEDVEHDPPTWIRLEFITCRLAKYYYALGDISRAGDYYQRAAESFLEHPNAMPFLSADLIDMQVRLWEAGAGQEQDPAARRERLSRLNPFKRAGLAEKTALARLCLAEGRPAEAAALLDEVYTFLQRSGGQEREIEVLLLRGCAALAAGDRPGARRDVQRAVQLAAPEGYLRPFVEQNAALGPLLAELPARPDGAGNFAARLAGALSAGTLSPAAEQPAPAPQAVSLAPAQEPLSEREEEVARLLHAGKT